MATLQLDVKKAKRLYKTAAPEFKEMLIDSFGASTFTGSIIERCHTVEDACLELGIDFSKIYEGAKDDYEKAEIDIKIFAKALREDKEASECFYYPYFDRSGGGFSYDGCGCGLDFAYVGARLRVDTSEKAKHLGKCMESQYKTYLNG